MKTLYSKLLLTLPISIFAQFFPVDNIPQELKTNSNAIVRSEETLVTLNSVNDYKYSNEIVITVFEKSGDSFVDTSEMYDPNTKIDVLEFEIYDAAGKSVKKYKLKDFADASAVTGGQLYTDNRVKYLEYTPTFYPYTVRFKVSTTNKNTLFLPRWFPIQRDNQAIESSRFTFKNNSTSTIRHLEKNLNNYSITKNIDATTFSYELKNQKAIVQEDNMVSWRNFLPHVVLASDQINIDGTQGKFDNWEDYGKWSHKNLVAHKLDFTPAQKSFFQDLVKDAKSEREKVEILYNYMQKKVRYIGVQLGIGGLSPFPNSYVESKSYGDCKALSNYMVGMLDAVGIKAYHTILTADDTSIDINDEMMYQQGNHMIVYVPLKDEEIWVEATSQTSPFNHLGEMSGNRKVYIFDENGGKVISSQNFDHQNNLLTTKGVINIGLDGNTDFVINETSQGLFYDDNSYYKSLVRKDQESSYKRKFPNLVLPTIQDISFKDSWKDAKFETHLKISSKNYVKKQGNNLIFNLIPINNEISTLKTAKQRNYDFHVHRGYTDYIEFEINVPQGLKSEIKIQPIDLKSEFGSYQLTVEKVNNSKYIIKRKYQQIKGNYDKSKFNDYVEFRRQVASNDNIKTLLEL